MLAASASNLSRFILLLPTPAWRLRGVGMGCLQKISFLWHPPTLCWMIPARIVADFNKSSNLRSWTWQWSTSTFSAHFCFGEVVAHKPCGLEVRPGHGGLLQRLGNCHWPGATSSLPQWGRQGPQGFVWEVFKVWGKGLDSILLAELPNFMVQPWSNNPWFRLQSSQNEFKGDKIHRKRL